MYEKMLESSIAAMSGKDIENTVIATGDNHPIVEVSDPTSTTVEAADVVVGERNLDDATAKAEAQIKDFTKLREYIRLFGVDRTLVSLLNNDNKLSSMFGVSIPSCESINGSPTTFLSKACLTSDVPVKKIAASLKEVCDHAIDLSLSFTGWLDTVETSINSTLQTATKHKKTRLYNTGVSGTNVLSKASINNFNKFMLSAVKMKNDTPDNINLSVLKMHPYVEMLNTYTDISKSGEVIKNDRALVQNYTDTINNALNKDIKEVVLSWDTYFTNVIKNMKKNLTNITSVTDAKHLFDKMKMIIDLQKKNRCLCKMIESNRYHLAVQNVAVLDHFYSREM